MSSETLGPDTCEDLMFLLRMLTKFAGTCGMKTRQTEQPAINPCSFSPWGFESALFKDMTVKNFFAALLSTMQLKKEALRRVLLQAKHLPLDCKSDQRGCSARQ